MQNLKKLIRTDSWVIPYLKTYKGLLALIVFLGFMTVFSGGALMFTSGFLISRSAQRPENILMVYVPIVLTRAFGIGRPSFRYAERLVSHNWVLRIVSKFRKRLFQLVEANTKSIYAKTQTGDMLNVLANDLDKIENFYLRLVFPTIIGFVLYLFITVGVGIFNPFVGLYLLILIGMITVLAPLVTLAVNGARDYQKKQLEANMYTRVTDAVMGLEDWILAGRTAELIAQEKQHLSDIWTLTRRQKHFTWWRTFLSELVIGLAALLLLWFADVRFGDTSFGVNWVAAFALAIFPMSDAFISIATGAEELPRYQDSIERLNHYSTDAVRVAEPVQQPTLTQYDIQINALSFAYEDDQNVLTNISLAIPAQQKLAILGQSGAGKTTLLKLLLGDEIPQAGSISIGGVSPAALLANRARYLAVLDQHPYLFASSVANNLRLGNLQATDEELWTALRKVRLTHLVESLPEGLNTPMTEMGQRFSGGEQQRFALARILLQDTPIVILDEPTVGLDPITERAVLEIIFEVLAEKTVIWVTHHLTGIELVDKIIFIENQTIMLSGTLAELMNSSARFNGLLEMDHGALIQE